MLKVVVVQGRTDSLSVMSVRFIKVKVEISEEYEFMRKKAIMVQKGVKLRKEHDRFVTNSVQPGFSDKHYIKIMFNNKIRNNFRFPIFACRLGIKQTHFKFIMSQYHRRCCRG